LLCPSGLLATLGGQASFFGLTGTLCYKTFSLPLRRFPPFSYLGGISEPPPTVSFSEISKPLLKGNKVRTTPGFSRRF
jgi:hypothetical protein